MGLTIINKKKGSGITAGEFQHKVKTAQRLLEEICEDTEIMIEEFNQEYSERDHYQNDYPESRYYRDEYVKSYRR